MPNHVTNRIDFIAPNEATRARLFDDLTTSDESDPDLHKVTFAKIVPEPEFSGDNRVGPSGSMPDWYEWRVANWGTKWDAYGDGQAYEHGNTICADFLTAWSYPKEFLDAVVAQFPGVHIRGVWIDEGGPFGTIDIRSA